MTKTNDSFSDDLAQIRKQQLELIDEVNSIKEQYAGKELEDIERIKEAALQTLEEIDEIRCSQGSDESAGLETAGQGDSTK